MSAKEIKALGRHLVEEFNKGKSAGLAVIEELYANNVVYHGADGTDIHGLKGYKQHNAEFYDAVPDAHFTIDDVVVERNKGVWRLTLTGTLTGALRGIPPTNKKAKIPMIIIDRIAKGKFVEEWESYDRLGAYQQLGIIPTPTGK
jgi:predicted ester cyclase